MNYTFKYTNENCPIWYDHYGRPMIYSIIIILSNSLEKLDVYTLGSRNFVHMIGWIVGIWLAVYLFGIIENSWLDDNLLLKSELH
jgi:hypothetical protein